jgi:hypothetical protein
LNHALSPAIASLNTLIVSSEVSVNQESPTKLTLLWGIETDGISQVFRDLIKLMVRASTLQKQIASCTAFKLGIGYFSINAQTSSLSNVPQVLRHCSAYLNENLV